MVVRSILVAATVYLLFPLQALAQRPAGAGALVGRPVAQASRITGEIRMHGHVDEEAWCGAEPSSSSAGAGLSVTWRPTTAARVQVGPNPSMNRSAAQFITSAADPLAKATFGRRYLFSEIDQTTLSMDTRLDGTFSPTLSLQLFAQPFIAAGELRQRQGVSGHRGRSISTCTARIDARSADSTD